VLALTQLIGGVSLELIFGMLLGTLGCLASLTALSLFLSVISRQGRDALVRTFLVVIVLIGCWFLLYQLRNSSILDYWLNAVDANSARKFLSQVLNLNPVFIVVLLREQLAVTGNIDGLPLRWFGECFGLHLMMAAILVALSMLVVRRRFLSQVDSNVKRDRQVKAYTKPAVWGGYPLYWKERYVHSGSWRLFGWMRWIKQYLFPTNSLQLVFVIISFSVLGIGLFALTFFPVRELNAEPVRVLLLWVMSGLLLCSLLAAILRTASAIAVEKDRETWEALMASPVSTQDMILSRLYGGLLSARWLWLSAIVLMLLYAWNSGHDYSFSHGNRASDYLASIVFIVANIGYLIFALCLAGYFSLSSNSSIRNVMSALTVLLTLNLLPFVVQWFFQGSNSTNSLVAIIYFVTDPNSVIVMIGLGLLAILSVVLYYKMPRMRWLYELVKGLGNLFLLNAILLLVLSSFTFAFGGFLPFERVVMFVAPLILDYRMLSEYIFPVQQRYYYYDRDSGGAMLFLISSSVVFTVVGLLLYWLSVRKLKRTCGRVEYSRLAVKQRRLLG